MIGKLILAIVLTAGMLLTGALSLAAKAPPSVAQTVEVQIRPRAFLRAAAGMHVGLDLHGLRSREFAEVQGIAITIATSQQGVVAGTDVTGVKPARPDVKRDKAAARSQRPGTPTRATTRPGVSSPTPVAAPVSQTPARRAERPGARAAVGQPEAHGRRPEPPVEPEALSPDRGQPRPTRQ